MQPPPVTSSGAESENIMEKLKISVSRYRALNLAGDTTKGISTQGFFAGLDDLKSYITKRGLDNGEVLRVEREQNGKWMFVQNIVIA